jgi:hypothetical protein
MSNPSGTDHDDLADSGAGTVGQQPTPDSDPATEVIQVTELSEVSEVSEVAPQTDSSTPATGERRYTAPGFDAGSTQIIDRLPDDETEFIATATDAFPATAQPRTAAPQAIPPRTQRRPRWLIPILLALTALLAAVILGVVLLIRANAAKAAQNMVRSTIETFDTAVRNGDLATLREVTCGQTREDYDKFDDKSWADASTRILAANQYPVISSIDEVVINDDHAEANVTSYMAFDPATASTRSFDLQFRDEQWKICQSSS